MSISRVDFYSQLEHDKRSRAQQTQLIVAQNYLINNNIDFEKFDTQTHVQNTSPTIEHIIDISDCYINKHLKTYEFESSFDGLIVYVCGKTTKIYPGDIVNVKPLAIVYIGSHRDDYTRKTTSITRVKDVDLRLEEIDPITCVVNILLNKPNVLKLTGVENITASLL